MKKIITIIAIVAIATFYLYRGGILTELPKGWKNTYMTIIKGNKTIHENLVLDEGLISPGHSPGKIIVTGNLTMGSGATYKCELKDLTGAGSGHDQIDVSGNLTLNGSLKISLLGYNPNSNDQFEIMKYGGNLTGTFSTITGLPAGWQIDYGVLLPGKINIYGSGSAIPIELLNFKAKKDGRQVILSWQTASEQNSDYFIVEHSEDGRIFVKLGQTKAMGMSNAIQNYSFVDNNPVSGVNYYRLRQMDLDGKSGYSKVTSVTINDNIISFYPNPASKIISFNRPVKSVSIHDIHGKEVLRSKSTNPVLNIASLQPGMYIIDVNNGQYKSRLIVEKP